MFINYVIKNIFAATRPNDNLPSDPLISFRLQSFTMQMNFTLVSLQLLLFQVVSKSVDARTDEASTYVQEGNRTCVSFFFSRSKKRFSR